MKIKDLFLLVVLLFQSFVIVAQSKQVTPQNLYWLRYTNQISLSPRFVLQNEIEDRRFFTHNRHHHLIIHSRLHYRFSKTEIAAGLTYSLQSPQNPEAMSKLVVPEIRPVQEVTYQTSFSNIFSIQNRWRLEERFIHKNDGIQLLDGYDFNFRLRYRIQAVIKLSLISKAKPTLVKVSNEIMLNAGKQIIYNQFDQNRVSLAIDQNVNSHLSVELGFIHWYQQRQSGYQFYKREISRLTISQKF